MNRAPPSLDEERLSQPRPEFLRGCDLLRSVRRLRRVRVQLFAVKMPLGGFEQPTLRFPNAPLAHDGHRGSQQTLRIGRVHGDVRRGRRELLRGPPRPSHRVQPARVADGSRRDGSSHGSLEARVVDKGEFRVAFGQLDDGGAAGSRAGRRRVRRAREQLHLADGVARRVRPHDVMYGRVGGGGCAEDNRPTCFRHAVRERLGHSLGYDVVPRAGLLDGPLDDDVHHAGLLALVARRGHGRAGREPVHRETAIGEKVQVVVAHDVEDGRVAKRAFHHSVELGTATNLPRDLLALRVPLAGAVVGILLPVPVPGCRLFVSVPVLALVTSLPPRLFGKRHHEMELSLLHLVLPLLPQAVQTRTPV